MCTDWLIDLAKIIKWLKLNFMFWNWNDRVDVDISNCLKLKYRHQIRVEIKNTKFFIDKKVGALIVDIDEWWWLMDVIILQTLKFILITYILN